jgi:hypothetical protein
MAEDYVKIYQRVVESSGRIGVMSPRQEGAVAPRRNEVPAGNGNGNGTPLSGPGSAINLPVSFR